MTDKTTAVSRDDQTRVELGLCSPMLRPGEPLPDWCLSTGANLPPDLQWDEPPTGTVEVALLCRNAETLNAATQPYLHWLVSGIQPGVCRVRAGQLPANALASLTDAGKFSWTGPDASQSPHVVFEVHAASQALGLKLDSTYSDLQRALRGCELGRSTLDVGLTSKPSEND